jgi:rubrerythrin
MAIETEKKGTAFYESVANTAKSPAVREFAQRMADAEREHEQTFTAMLPRVETYSPPESYPGEYLNYVDTLLDRDVLPGEEEGKRLAAEAESELQAVDFAIQFEKSTIVFLHEMKNFVPEHQKDVVDKLLDEERSHVVELSQFRKTLQ